MSFLTSLLGSEHIERYIPLATGKAPDTGTSGTVEQPRIRGAAKAAAIKKSTDTAPVSAKATPTSATHRSATGSHKRPARQVTSAGAPAAVSKPTSKPVARAEPAPASPPKPRDAMTQRVIADAVRMLEWGREWPALAGLIARMADRPSEGEIWKILRAYRNDILATSRRTG
jgi:hypothetical protein